MSKDLKLFAMASTKEEEEESFSYAIQLVTSTTLPNSMKLAVDLGIFDIISKVGAGAGLSSSQIAAQIGTKNPEAPMMLDRILRLLASHSVLNCTVVNAKNDDEHADRPNFQRVYSLAPVSKNFVKSDEDGVSLGALMALHQDKVFLDSWFGLKDSIVEGGIAFNRVHGTDVFEYPGLDPRFNRVFNTAMFCYTTLVMKKMLLLYKGFEPLKQLIDVGGGTGMTLSLITSRYPDIKGINFDLPHVIKDAPSYTGVEHVGGDMFTSVPNGDAILIKWVLHNWGDEHCLKLLKNCYNATPDNGKVIVVDAILPVMPETSTGVKNTTQMDVVMMTIHPGGKERSKQEFLALATAAGFRGIRYECFVGNYWVMEFFK